MAKFKAGDAVKLRDDVEYGKMYNKITLLEEVKKSTKYHIDEVANPNSRSGPDYKILGLDMYVGEDALEAWPESTEETKSNKIDPQLFELVKLISSGIYANPRLSARTSTKIAQFAIDAAKETLRLLREEKTKI